MNDPRLYERRSETAWYLYMKGFSMQEIAEIFKISKARAYQLVMKKKEENQSQIAIEQP